MQQILVQRGRPQGADLSDGWRGRIHVCQESRMAELGRALQDARSRSADGIEAAESHIAQCRERHLADGVRKRVGLALEVSAEASDSFGQ